MKILNGAELAEYIKERQARQVRALRQAHGVFPRLAIIQTTDDPVIGTYVRLKRRYGDDILVDVVILKIDQSQLMTTIEQVNNDPNVHGIIIQLPLADVSETQVAVDAVLGTKDVDGLGKDALYQPATPMAIDWLVTGYNVELKQKAIAIVGRGRLVGEPLARLWRGAGHDVTILDKESDLTTELPKYDVIVSATGSVGVINSDMLQIGAVIVDAGTAAEHGKIVGDIDQALRTRDDLTITPEKGGVGPLTVAALFDNVIRSAQEVARTTV